MIYLSLDFINKLSNNFHKKQSNKWRFCIKYQNFNDIIINNHYPLPKVQELQNHFHGVKIFTKMDFHSAYNLTQIKIKKKNNVLNTIQTF